MYHLLSPHVWGAVMIVASAPTCGVKSLPVCRRSRCTNTKITLRSISNYEPHFAYSPLLSDANPNRPTNTMSCCTQYGTLISDSSRSDCNFNTTATHKPTAATTTMSSITSTIQRKIAALQSEVVEHERIVWWWQRLLAVQDAHPAKLWYTDASTSTSMTVQAAYNTINTSDMSSIKRVKVPTVTGTFLDTGNPVVTVQYKTFSVRGSRETARQLANDLKEADLYRYLSTSIATELDNVRVCLNEIASLRAG